MTPVETYTAQATVGDVNKGVTNHKNLESSDTALLVFGNGDGGGGPLNKMFENVREVRISFLIMVSDDALHSCAVFVL